MNTKLRRRAESKVSMPRDRRAGYAALLLVCSSACAGATHTPTPGTSSASAVASSVAAPSTKPLVLLDPVSVPHVDTTDLANEIHLAVVERPGSIAEIRVVVGSGSAADASHPGLAFVTARLVSDTYATEAKNDARAAQQLTFVVRPDATIFSARTPPDGLAPTIAALGKALTKPTIDVPAARAAITRTGNDVRERTRDLDSIAERLIQRDLWLARIGRHPYSLALPTDEEVRALDGKLARTFFDQSYVAKNLAVVVVGAVDANAVEKLLTEALGKASAADKPALTLDEPDARPQPLKIMLVDDPTREVGRLTIGRFGPPAAEARDTAVDVEGIASAARLRAATGSTASFRVVPFAAGPALALVEANVNAANIGRAVEAIGKEAEAWQKDLTPAELVAAKNERTGEILRLVDPPGALADRLAFGLGVGTQESSLEREAFELSTLASADVTAIARRVLSSDTIVVVVGDARVLAAPLSELGVVDVLDPGQGFQRVRSVTKDAAPAAPAPKE